MSPHLKSLGARLFHLSVTSSAAIAVFFLGPVSLSAEGTKESTLDASHSLAQLRFWPESDDSAVEKSDGVFAGYVKFVFESGGELFLHPRLAGKAEIKKSGDPAFVTSVSFPLGGIRCAVMHDNDGSDDPTFRFGESPDLDNATAVKGSVVHVSAEGDFWVQSFMNEIFPHSRSYRFSGGEGSRDISQLLDTTSFVQGEAIVFRGDHPHPFEEVAQPFYLVDLDSLLSEELVLRDRRNNRGNAIAKLPKGSRVRVLLKDNEALPPEIMGALNGDYVSGAANYLIATESGVVGWTVAFPGDIASPGRPLNVLRRLGD